jgi:DNA-binding NtrC family response regulator
VHTEGALDRPFTILIADRNRHVREFLKREIRAEGYSVLLAKTAREVLDAVYDSETVDILILDPDLPEASELGLLEQLTDRIPPLPVIIHAFRPHDTEGKADLSGGAFVEKQGDSIERLKTALVELQRKRGVPQALGRVPLSKGPQDT